MKKIAWITPSCYIDVDLPIINELRRKFIIHWSVILAKSDGKDVKEYALSPLGDKENIIVNFYRQEQRLRSFKNVLFIYKVIKTAKKFNPDYYYISEYAMPYGVLLYKLLLPMKKTIAACHNVKTPKGARDEIFVRKYTHLWLLTFCNIQTFSESQCQYLKSKFKDKNVLMAYLALKDYGEPSVSIDKIRTDKIRFLFFGHILKYKRVDLLLEAVNILYDRGFNNFEVRIAGQCPNWETEYADKVRHPELLDLQIRRINNEDVASLFSDSHYFVMPYQDIAQSGAITVAFRYSVPVLASDIPQFKEFVHDCETGYFFKSQDAKSLADKMEWLLEEHKTIYSELVKRQKAFSEKNLSLNSIVKKYIDYIEKL